MIDRVFVVSTISFIVLSSLILGDDEEKKPLVATPEQRAILENDPFIKKAIGELDRDLRLAEEAYRNSKISHSTKSLEVYLRYQQVFTMSGDFDKALACKSMIEDLENSGLDGSRPKPKDIVKLNGHSYAIVREAVTWHVAKKRCEQMGGHLAFAKNTAALHLIAKLSVGVDVHIGASDEEKEGDWRWLDGTKFSLKGVGFDNLMTYQHHLMWNSGQSRLDDDFAGHRAYYICEWD